ncbi:glycosyltransferase [Roseivirga sp. BDSF3-8]|uniref:glycosyltransferase n=1 Tax=Roseivirga sp. BDSF3-8 TaxID=3241598 RepID=UPI0035323460
MEQAVSQEQARTSTIPLEGYDIIMLALPRFDGPYASNSYSIAREFAKTHRVFLIDNPYTIKDYLSERKQPTVKRRKEALLKGKNIYYKPEGVEGDLTVVTPKLVYPINWMNPGGLYESLSKINDKIVYKTIERILRDHNVERFMYFNSYHPLFGKYFPDSWQPDFDVYHCMDDVAHSEYLDRHGPEREDYLVARADLTITTSRELCRLKKKASDKVVYLPNAAYSHIFRKAVENDLPRPEEMKGLEGKKVIGYTGNLDTRPNYPLIRKVAEQHKDKVIVLVGPRNSKEIKEQRLDEMDNIIFTGSKKLEELPGYLKYMDAVMIPFKCNTLTRSIYPLKINEYLAAGRAVISTRFSEDIQDFEEVIRLADSEDEFVRLAGEAAEGSTNEEIKKRMAVADSNTWEKRVKQFWQLVAERTESLQ